MRRVNAGKSVPIRLNIPTGALCVCHTTAGQDAGGLQPRGTGAAPCFDAGSTLRAQPCKSLPSFWVPTSCCLFLIWAPLGQGYWCPSRYVVFPSLPPEAWSAAKLCSVFRGRTNKTWALQTIPVAQLVSCSGYAV